MIYCRYYIYAEDKKKPAYGLGIVPLKECIELTGSQVFLSNEQINTIIDNYLQRWVL
jgi:hypothetical protein